MAAGNMAKPYGINSEGLRRRGFSADIIARIKRAYRSLYRSGLSLEDAKRELATQSAACREVGTLLEFLARSRRGFIR
jgi:UDP-N-acetylglucosamine acyltransferase